MTKMRYILGICLIALGLNATAQDMTMYQMRTLPQNLQVNPALRPTSTWYVGGGILPFPILFPLNMNISNGFAFSDIIQGNEDGSSAPILDPTNYIQNMNATESFNFGMQLDILNFGFQIKKHYFTLGYQERIQTSALYSKALFDFAWQGNGSEALLGDTTRISNFGMDFKHYGVLKLGYNYQVDDKLTVGASPNIYFGKGFVSSQNSYIDIYTSEGVDAMSVTPYIEVQAGGMALDDVLTLIDNDSTNNAEIDPAELGIGYGANYGNVGFGIDLGATYKIDDHIDVSMSVIDLGFINWGSNSKVVSNTAQTIEFNGLDVQSLLGTSDSSGGFMDSMLNSLTSIADIKDSTVSLKSNLPTRLYMGANYKLNDKVSGGILLRQTFRKNNSNLAVSLNANVALSNRLSAVATYNIMNGKYNNVGFGTAVNLGAIQMYFVMDNALGLTRLDYANDVSFRFGFNIKPVQSQKRKDKKAEKKAGKTAKPKKEKKAESAE